MMADPEPPPEPDIQRTRAERREEIKLVLEYAKLALSFVGFAGIIFAALQWKTSNSLAQQNITISNQNTYQRITSDWQEHLRTFIEKPGLRPYFEDGLALSRDSSDRNLVLSVADVRLDVIDAIISSAHIQGFTTMEGWMATFRDAFRTSSVLCARLLAVGPRYGPTIRQIGAETCTSPPDAAGR